MKTKIERWHIPCALTCILILCPFSLITFPSVFGTTHAELTQMYQVNDRICTSPMDTIGSIFFVLIIVSLALTIFERVKSLNIK